jgi:hypothetical protein
MSPNRHSNFPYRKYNPFDWENLDELTCKVELRFDKQDIPRLQEALQFQKWFPSHMLRTVLDWKLCAYCSKDLPTQCDTVIWFPCLADQCLNYVRWLNMQSIIFTTTIVSDYKAGIDHFYLQRIWHPMQIYAIHVKGSPASSNMLWFHRWHSSTNL